MDAYVSGKKIRLDPKRAIGKGGEADIFDIGGGEVAKIFKPPTHPDLSGSPHEQTAAELRIREHQKKLPAFPTHLPARVVAPRNLITDQSGRVIVGYTMPFLQGAEVLYLYGDRTFRSRGIGNDVVTKIFLDLADTTAGVHRSGVVIGDFNDLNVLVRGAEAHIIDADSMQFGAFTSHVFTAKFVDPLLCNPRGASPELVKPHNDESDWYAFAIMLMQSLLFVGPYGGVHAPHDPKKKVAHDARSLHRITVFDPEVRYPKPAIPYGVLPDELLDYFHRVFKKDERGIFPVQLLRMLVWNTCAGCGVVHARRACPNCTLAPPAAIKETTVVRGTVKATTVFKTTGIIVHAAVQDNDLKWLYHEAGAFKREDRTTVIAGGLDPHMRFRVCGTQTLMAKNGVLGVMSKDKNPERTTVDSVGMLPVFDANDAHRYWVAGGQLLRESDLGQFYIGDVLEGQTLFWVGASQGFGFYRAGSLTRAFIFHAERRGINDNVKLPPLRGQLVDATAVFGTDRVWFLTTTREGGKTINRCTVISTTGAILATAEADDGDGSWLGTIRGACAIGTMMLVPTDLGIVRVEVDHATIVKTKEFPDTEPFVDAGCLLFAAKNGLYVVDRKEIRLLKIS